MNSNPIVEALQEERALQKAQAAFRYPFHIVCIYEDEDSNDFPIIRDVKKHCAENHMTFLGRQYDFERYQEDMFIKRLPAFHIYYKKYVQETHHYDEDPVQKINLVLWAYQDEQRAKERAKIRRQERWDAFVEGFNSIFTLDHFKRKPHLDPTASLTKERMQTETPTPSLTQSTADDHKKRGVQS